MTATDLLWRWLIQSAVMCGLVLIAGAFAARFVREPADRLRLIQWVLVGCLLAPFVGGLSTLTTLSINLVDVAPANAPAAIDPVSDADIRHGDPTVRSLNMRVDSELVPSAGDSSPRGGLAQQTSADNSATASKSDGVANTKATVAQVNSRTVRLADATTLKQEWGVRDIRNWAVAAYLCFIAVIGVRWLIGLWRLFKLKRHSAPASAEVRQLFDRLAGNAGNRVQLFVSDWIDGPITWGLLRPVIVVPSRFAEQTGSSQLRWCLAHEWSHVERRDMGTLLLANVVQTFSYYQPLYWWLRRQLILCQDFIADARASRETGTAEDYAEFLVNLARSRLRPSLPALGIVDRESQLSRRVKMLIESDGPVRSRCGRLASLLIAGGALALLVALSTVELDAAAGPDSGPQAANASTNNSVEGTKNAATADPKTESPPQTPAAQTTAPRDAEEAEVGVVKGILVNAADGSPVMGAQVNLHGARIYNAQSGADGRFRFEKIPPFPRQNRGQYQIWAYVKNLVTARTQVDESIIENTATATFAPLRLEMTPGKRAKFRVGSAATGQPIEGARIRFGYPDRRETKTAADGTAIVEGLLPQLYQVTIEAEGYARYAPEIDLTRSELDTEYNASLALGGVARGIVIDETGKPVPGAGVAYFVAGESGSFLGDAAQTDSDGRFRHRFLPLNASIEIAIRKQDHVSQRNTIVLTPEKRELDVKLTLPRNPRGGSIAGIVRDAKGNPVPGAKLENRGIGFNATRPTTTDAEGRFVLHDLLNDRAGYAIYVSAKGFAPQMLSVTPGTAESPGAVTVILQPGHSIRGQVLDENGHPAKEAYISAQSGAYPLQGNPGVRIPEDGRFAFDSLPADARFNITHAGYATRGNLELQLDGAEPIVVRLQAPGVIRGRVVDAATNRPLPQFRVSLVRSNLQQQGDPQGSFNARWYQPGVRFRSASGEFLAEPFVDGMPFELTIDAEGYERFVMPRVLAARANAATSIDVSLNPIDPAKRATFAGVIIDHTGKPASGAQLRLIVSSDQPTGISDNRFNWTLIRVGQLAQKSYCEQFLSGVSDREGHFEFKGILPGKYLQLVYWGDGVPRGRFLVSDQSRSGKIESVTIKLPEPGTIRGSINPSKFPQIGSIGLLLHGDSMDDFRSELRDDQSSFEFNNLPPGEYSVVVWSKPVRLVENGGTGYKSSALAQQTVPLKAGETKDVKFTEPDAKKP